MGGLPYFGCATYPFSWVDRTGTPGSGRTYRRPIKRGAGQELSPCGFSTNSPWR